MIEKAAQRHGAFILGGMYSVFWHVIFINVGLNVHAGLGDLQ